MKKIKISINDKEYLVELAETEEQQEQGLQHRSSLAENEGMLFIFDEEESKGFWMKDTLIPLDIIFINDDLVVTAIHKGIPNSEEVIEDIGTYVLEVNANSGIKIGNELEFSTHNQQYMYVLNPDGGIQMVLKGGERIMSRDHTKKLIKFAKKAYITSKDSDFKALGKRMFKFLKIQDETAPEYVEGINDNDSNNN